MRRLVSYFRAMYEKLLVSYLIRVSNHKHCLRLFVLNLKTQEQKEFKDFSELSDFMERSSLSPPDAKGGFDL